MTSTSPSIRKYKAGDILYSEVYDRHIMVLGVVQDIIYQIISLSDGSRANLIASGVERYYTPVT